MRLIFSSGIIDAAAYVIHALDHLQLLNSQRSLPVQCTNIYNFWIKFIAIVVFPNTNHIHHLTLSFRKKYDWSLQVQNKKAYMFWRSLAVVHFVLSGRRLSLAHCTPSQFVDSGGAWSSHLHQLLCPGLDLELRKKHTWAQTGRTHTRRWGELCGTGDILWPQSSPRLPL